MYKEAMVVNANDIEIVYDAFGNPEAPPILLIMGLGRQMISWDNQFCTQLSERGYYVIRFDNRDVGLSTKFNGTGIPDFSKIKNAVLKGENAQVPYNLNDMADDVIGLFNALDIDSAHVTGISMGGMIAQMLGICHSHRIRTITSIMSSTGDPDLPSPTPEALKVILTPTPTDREGYIDSAVESANVFSGPLYPFDETYTRKMAAKFYDRGISPAGTARQYAAIMASGSRKEQLKSIETPTLIIHGDADPLIPLACGQDTARSIPGATLKIIKGLGHSLPPSVWSEIIEAIADHTDSNQIAE